MGADEGKKWRDQGKRCLWSLLGALAFYGLLQLLNALLIAGGTVGEENAGILVCLSAGAAVFIAALVGLRREQRARLLLCGAVVLGFAAVVLAGMLAQEEESRALGNVAGILLAALLGGLAAAVSGGKKGGRRRKTRRR